MEKLCGVWDGSEKKEARGYHLCRVTASNLEHNKIVPLYCEAYSSQEKDYVTSTEKVKKVISKVIEKTGLHGVWLLLLGHYPVYEGFKPKHLIILIIVH